MTELAANTVVSESFFAEPALALASGNAPAAAGIKPALESFTGMPPLLPRASELERVGQFDYVVINREGHLDDAVSQICAIIAAEKQRVFPRHVRL